MLAIEPSASPLKLCLSVKCFWHFPHPLLISGRYNTDPANYLATLVLSQSSWILGFSTACNRSEAKLLYA